MKRSIIFFSLFFSSLLWAAPPEVNRQFDLYRNLLPNPGFENGKSGWTASGVTFTLITNPGSVAEGLVSAQLQFTADGQTLVSPAIPVPKTFQSLDCVAQIYASNPDGGLILKVTDGGGTTYGSADFQNATSAFGGTWAPYDVHFQCPASGNIQLIVTIEDGIAPINILLDKAYLGPNFIPMNTIGTEKIGRARITNSGTCNINTQTSANPAIATTAGDNKFFASVSHPGTGQCLLTFSHSFADSPSCICNAEGNVNVLCVIRAFDNATVTIGTKTANTGADVDATFHVICQGTKNSSLFK